MAQWQVHEITVDSLLDKLRYAMLGFLQPCFPDSLPTRSQQRGAIRAIAERLTFCVAATIVDTNSANLLACRNRLYAVLTYLFFECLESDQTYYNLLRLMSLDADPLARMVQRCKHTPASFRRHYRGIADFDANLEPAVLLYLSQGCKLPPGYLCSLATERALETLRRENGEKILSKHCLPL